VVQLVCLWLDGQWLIVWLLESVRVRVVRCVGYSTDHLVAIHKLNEQDEQSDWQDGIGHCCELVLTELLNGATEYECALHVN
jgi:hypothetical protein